MGEAPQKILRGLGAGQISQGQVSTRAGRRNDPCGVSVVSHGGKAAATCYAHPGAPLLQIPARQKPWMISPKLGVGSGPAVKLVTVGGYQ